MSQVDDRSDPGCEELETVMVKPVGIIRNKLKEPILAAKEGGIAMQVGIEEARAHIREARREVSEIVVRENLVDILDGIEEYSHLVILYWAHKVPEQGRLLTRVHPMGRKEFPEVGIFGTCSPARPNPVLMTVVRLHARKQNVLEVTGLDAIDGSPVIDIKPYVKELYPQEDVQVPEWMQRIQAEMNEDRQ